jgi:hypothetical protein
MREFARSFSFALLLASLSISACHAGSGADERPDVTGTWDLTYDDYLELELEIAGDVHQQRVSLSGGSIRARHMGKEIQAVVACARDEVVCPNEIWARQLTIASAKSTASASRFGFAAKGRARASSVRVPWSRRSLRRLANPAVITKRRCSRAAPS